jgi:hypothetical protein
VEATVIGRIFKVATVLLVTSLVAAGCNPLPGQSFIANLSGANEVPPILVPGSGTARLDVNGQTIRFNVQVFGMASNVTTAQIYGPAAPGVNAGVIVTLFSGSAPPPVNGVLVQGAFGPANIDPASGLSWNQFVDLLRSEQTYVNIHTTGNPAGEVRGQLRLLVGIE